MKRNTALTRYRGPPIKHARNKELLTYMLEMGERGLLQVDPATGRWTMTPAGYADMRLHHEYKEMMSRRDLWPDEMREIHERRKAAVDDCLFAIAGLDAADRSIVKDRLRDLFDLEEGILSSDDVSSW